MYFKRKAELARILDIRVKYDEYHEERQHETRRISAHRSPHLPVKSLSLRNTDVHCGVNPSVWRTGGPGCKLRKKFLRVRVLQNMYSSQTIWPCQGSP